MSPHKVPLPASRPSTPVRIPRSPPANSPGFKLHEKAPKPPSRSGSPSPHVPPPIPRRAAARTRPLSSSGIVPVSVPPLAKEASPEKEDPQEKPEEKKGLPLSTGSEENVQPNDHSVGIVEKSSAVEEHPTEKQSTPISTPIPEQDESVVSEKTEDEALTPPPPPAYESGPDQPEIQDIKKPIAGSEEEKENGVVDEPEPEQDNGLYVGDSTWEERTWKELVRLREEMFWARIGGLR
ncbi:hypothetical protein NLI96_g3298 [Meripilus lineatus]|uniref:Uncharacterized protein n=1 Tax=Meripilus lineatus TaxID=2056292 RepID=A0AAD5V746_9APHY|nr:hypothetical protein NLI96_g3298 [Physisporinus lineatus]